MSKLSGCVTWDRPHVSQATLLRSNVAQRTRMGPCASVVLPQLCFDPTGRLQVPSSQQQARQVSDTPAQLSGPPVLRSTT